jgi:alpha-beta hydrolase superfamily lysophospholipase
MCFCHGYSDNASFAARIEYQRLCQAGIAFVSIEYEGHGRSDGPFGLVSDWELLVVDVGNFFQQVTSQRFPGVPVFLMGESMGGAVAYDACNRLPKVFRGAIFCAPMFFKIHPDMRPPRILMDMFRWIVGPSGSTSLLGYLPITPIFGNKNLSEVDCKSPQKLELMSSDPVSFERNPRLATAREMAKTTERIGGSGSFREFDLPFLVLHGLSDQITDPRFSQEFYDESPSNDKTIRLYQGMWHALTAGEADEDIDRVFDDVIQWILAQV